MSQPPHVGHRSVIERVLEACGVGLELVVEAAVSPYQPYSPPFFLFSLFFFSFFFFSFFLFFFKVKKKGVGAGKKAKEKQNTPRLRQRLRTRQPLVKDMPQVLHGGGDDPGAACGADNEV